MQVHSFLGNNKSAIWQFLYPRFKIQKNYTNNQFNSIMESKNKFTGCNKADTFSDMYLSFHGAEKGKQGYRVPSKKYYGICAKRNI